MSQNIPNATSTNRMSSGGYAAAMDGKSALWGGIEFGGNAHQTAVDDGGAAFAASTDADTVLFGGDTSNGNGGTLTLSSADAVEGRAIVVNDEGGNAGATGAAITIDTEGSETIDGGTSISIATNNGTARVYSDGSNWFTW